MFDPSKLDLNLDDSKDNNKNTNETEKNKISDILDDSNFLENSKKEEISNPNKQEKENNDILENIEVIDSKKNEETKVKEVEKKEVDGKTEYEKNIVKKPKVEEKLEEKQENKKIIFDINLTSLDILLNILIEKEYDFATFEPSSEAVKITFRKNKSIVETRYIKFPTYSDILIKAKVLTKLTVEETKLEQEGEGEKQIKDKNYKIITKVVPSELGAKLFIKTKEIDKKVVKKETKKTSIGDIMTFLGVILLIALIIGGGFISFIVMNAKTVEDVKFFYSLGINLNDINTFISKLVTAIFSVLIFIETLLLIIFLFKNFLTKKEFKQKKLRYLIISIFLFIITFSSLSAWMFIDEKIRNLPNWQEMAYGDIQVYDNSKLTSESFVKATSILDDTSNIIGPIDIKFDIEYFAKKEEAKGLKINKYIWDFGDGKIEETKNAEIIHNFDKKGIYNVALTIEQVNLNGEVIEKKVENIPSINISYIVDIKETKLKSGGKTVELDASSLKELGKIEWYFLDNLEKPVWEGNMFRPAKAIFEETIIGMYIRRNDKTSETLDKVFIINAESELGLDGEIVYNRSILNDLEYEIKLDNIENDFGNGFIEEFKWIIDGKEITKKGDPTNPSEASKINYNFKNYGKHEISVIIKNTAGEIKEISQIIDNPKGLKLTSPLKIYNNNEIIEDLNYDEKMHEYYINEIGAPTELKLDARFIRTDNILYTLEKVEWDYNSNGDIDESSKVGNTSIDIEGNHSITVNYRFKHRKIEDDIISLEEKIFIEAIKKEAQINFNITKDSDYIPAIISLDGSKSMVKDENIAKFIWDFGDGETWEGDSIIKGHKYIKEGTYNIKLTVITDSGKEYSKTKTLILKPKPQTIEIKASMLSAPVFQAIDFSSDGSEGHIIQYFWDFGDGNISTEANPSHSYQKSGNYKVNLTLDFANKNILEKSIDIEITK